MKALLLLIALMPLLGGCNTLGNAKDSRGDGMARVYPSSHEQVWRVVPRAANDLDLSIAGMYEDEGYILAERGATMMSWGERVAIFVDAIGPASTQVEVVSKRAVAVNITAADFEKQLLDKIGEMLLAPR